MNDFASDIDFASNPLPGARMHEALRELREQGPLARATFGGQPGYLITRFETLIEGFQDTITFPPATLYQNSIAKIIGPNFQSMEGAEHTLYRRLATPAFRSRAIERYGEEAMADLAHELLAQLDGKKEADLVASFTHFFPFFVICRLIGVPRGNEHEYQRWAWEMLGAPGTPIQDSHRAAAEFTRHLTPAIEARRHEPQDDVISALLQAEVDGRTLTDEEILSNVRLMFSAGATTTLDAIGSMLYLLLTEGDWWQQIVESPELRAGAIHEVLRYETPVPNLPRVSSTEAVEFAGHKLAPSTTVLFSMAAANRDPDVYEDPDHFDPTRPQSQLLTFGRGERSCPGMHLARKEMAVALDAIIDHFPNLHLRGDPTRAAPCGAIVRGPKTLPVALG
ncbi:MAG: cytochrome P450 [Deltaproteobacteria bacterium]|nr:cytochrome P450 [Deltaproteobacteria bacterium]MBW2386939.1 cytochrome P450 [Deltaproteobacteria bacterium]